MIRTWSRGSAYLLISFALLGQQPTSRPLPTGGDSRGLGDGAVSLERARQLMDAGRYREAEEQLRGLLVEARRSPPPSQSAASILNTLGLVLHRQGCYWEAYPLLLDAVVTAERIPGLKCSDMVNVLSNLGANYHERGVYDASETIYRRALGLYESGCNGDQAARAEALNNLATLALVTPKTGLAKLYKSADGPHEVESVPDLVLRDDKRGKNLQLRVSFPKDSGPFPVIVFAHGATGAKDDYQPLVRHWVSHGFVVIQANHSDSRALAGMSETGKVENKFRDWSNRPKDIVFIIDSLDMIGAKVPGLKGEMDKKTIGVGGHSFGAHTAQLVAGTTTVDFGGTRTSHADARPKAFVLISPQGKGPQLDDQSWSKLTRPFLLVTGSNDWGRDGDPVDWRLDPYRLAASKTKYLLYIEGAYHDFGGIGGGVQYRNAGPPNPNQVTYVKSTTTAFWDAYLNDDQEAIAYLKSNQLAEFSKGAARIEHK
jgi:dienelactone hydrolase